MLGQMNLEGDPTDLDERLTRAECGLRSMRDLARDSGTCRRDDRVEIG